MKAIVVVLVLVFLMAARGSRAEPVAPATSAAFQQCWDSCQPLRTLVARDIDGGENGEIAIVAGDVISEIAGPNRECLLCGNERYEEQRPSFGGLITPARSDVQRLVFDPPD